MTITTHDARLLRALFDTSFTEFITPKMVRLIYVLGLLGIGLWDAWLVFNALDQSLLAGLGTLLLVVLFTLVAAIVLRVWLEVTVIFFRIADNTAEAAEHGAEIALNTSRGSGRPVGTGSP